MLHASRPPEITREVREGSRQRWRDDLAVAGLRAILRFRLAGCHGQQVGGGMLPSFHRDPTAQLRCRLGNGQSSTDVPRVRGTIPSCASQSTCLARASGETSVGASSEQADTARPRPLLRYADNGRGRGSASRPRLRRSPGHDPSSPGSQQIGLLTRGFRIRRRPVDTALDFNLLHAIHHPRRR